MGKSFPVNSGLNGKLACVWGWFYMPNTLQLKGVFVCVRERERRRRRRKVTSILALSHNFLQVGNKALFITAFIFNRNFIASKWIG
jgi:hypothetical protein